MSQFARQLVKFLVGLILYVPVVFVLGFACGIARFTRRPIQVGIGPEPMINNIYHKAALISQGITAETFVSYSYFITNKFDVNLNMSPFPILFRSYWLFLRAVFRYKILFFYFNGGPLAWTYHRHLEGFLLFLSGTKSIVTAYGADVHDLLRSKETAFRAAVQMDYPNFQKHSRDKITAQIRRWSYWADHILGGHEWVDYLERWDSISPAHFCLPIPAMPPPQPPSNRKLVRILHAPNHENIKGTKFFVQAVDELIGEGLPVELRIVRGVPNSVIQEEIRNCDIVADQLLIGWYGFFAVEAMAAGRPVLCYLREDLLHLFRWSGHIKPNFDPPLANVNIENLKQELRRLIIDETFRKELGHRGWQFAKNVHSLDAVGTDLRRIVEKLEGRHVN